MWAAYVYIKVRNTAPTGNVLSACGLVGTYIHTYVEHCSSTYIHVGGNGMEQEGGERKEDGKKEGEGEGRRRRRSVGVRREKRELICLSVLVMTPPYSERRKERDQFTVIAGEQCI